MYDNGTFKASCLRSSALFSIRTLCAAPLPPLLIMKELTIKMNLKFRLKLSFYVFVFDLEYSSIYYISALVMYDTQFCVSLCLIEQRRGEGRLPPKYQQ